MESLKEMKKLSLEKDYKGLKFRAEVKNGEAVLKVVGFRSLSGMASWITKHPTSGRYFFEGPKALKKSPAKARKAIAA